MIKKINKRMYSVKINKLLLVLTSLITIFIFQNKVVAQCSVTISQPAEFTAGAIDSTGETICYGTVPSIIGNLDSAKGGRGSIRYEWRSSIDGYASPIPGATSPTYTPPSNLATTTTYRRYAKDSLCNPLYTKSLGSWTVTVVPLDTVTIMDTVCAGDSYNDYNFSYAAAYTTTGYTYLDTNENTNVHGCDSITMLSLYVRPVDSLAVTDTICAGIVYNSHGFTHTGVHTMAGYTYLDTNENTNVHGCDSITMLALYVRPVDSLAVMDTICAGIVYNSHGFTHTGVYTMAGYTYRDTLTKSNVHHCDSVTLLELYVRPVDSVVVKDTICAGVDYNKNGFVHTSVHTMAGYTHRDTLTKSNVHHCDSVTLLELYVRPVDSVVVKDTICAGVDYNKNGFVHTSVHTMAGYTHRDTLTKSNVHHCDSVTLLELYVRPVDSVVVKDTICAGVDYNKNGFVHTSVHTMAGYTHRDTLTKSNVHHCDSVTLLELYVRPVDSVVVKDTICAGVDYNKNGFVHTSVHTMAGYTHRDTLTKSNVHHCDSVTLLELYVRPVDSVVVKDTICAGVDYNKNGFVHTSVHTMAGYTHRDTLTKSNVHHCDSVTLLELYVRPVDSVVVKDTICAGVDYNKNGFVHTSVHTMAGYTHRDTLTKSNVHHCDSVTLLELYVRPVDSVVVKDTICAGVDYNSHGFTHTGVHTMAGYTYLDTTENTNVHGCDSITMLSLYVRPVDSLAVTDTICAGVDYNSHGFTHTGVYTMAGYTYLDTNENTNVHGCDSITMLALYVRPVDSLAVTDTICAGVNYNSHGFTHTGVYTMAGYTYLDTNENTNVHGCDSITMLSLYVRPVDSLAVTDTICAGVNYNSHGFTHTGVYTMAGYTYLDTNENTNVHGCDSITMLALYVRPVDSLAVTDTICAGVNYNSHGFTHTGVYTMAGYTYLDTNENTNVHGCDSITMLALYVRPVDSLAVTDTICAGVNYNSHGFTHTGVYTMAGYTYLDTNENTNVHGCDSITMLSLYVRPVDSLAVTDTICAGVNYNSHGFTHTGVYTMAGYTYLDTNENTNVHGCDSITMLSLYVRPVDSLAVTDTICAGVNYNSHGFTHTGVYTMAGYTYLDTNENTNVHGCDSITMLSLYVRPVDSLAVTDTICAGVNYNSHGFTHTGVYTMAGYTYLDTNENTNVHGCDSITMLALYVRPVDSLAVTDTICAGVNYNSHGFTHTGVYTMAGYTYLDTNENTNVHGCDSITMLSLYVRPVDSVYILDTICGGGHYTDNDFNIPIESRLTVYSITSVRTVGNIHGCDSVTTLTLHVLPVDSVKLTADICAGNTYTGYNFNIPVPYTTTGYTIYDTIRLTNVAGCDSITTLILSVLPVDSVKLTADICAGNTYTGYNFNIPVPYTTTGYTIYDTIRLTNVAGCDSITTLILSVLPVDSVKLTADICAGNTYTAYNFNIPVPYTTTAYTIYDTIRLTNVAGCDSITTLMLHVFAVDSIYIVDSICSGEHYKLNGFDVQTTSSYEEIVIEKVNRTVNIKGCDSTTFLTLIVHPIPEVSLGEDISVCHDTIYPVVLDPGAQYSSYLWNTGSRTQTLSVTKGGEYSVVVANEHNCLNSDTVEVVDLTDMYVKIESLYDFCDNMRTILIANTNVDVDAFLWNTGEKSESIDVTKSGTYSVTATKMTCQVYDFYVIDSCDFRLFIPNTITPSDNNGLNDCFEIHFPSTYEIANLTIEIYDRWGNKVFHSNSPDFKWYGTTKNGKVAHDNTFVYTLVLEINGVKHTFKGTILVM
ncbi:MAG: gliding motility-associated C-terminal domain-containing protein [Bacteroidales bacterium]